MFHSSIYQYAWVKWGMDILERVWGLEPCQESLFTRVGGKNLYMVLAYLVHGTS